MDNSRNRPARRLVFVPVDREMAAGLVRGETLRPRQRLGAFCAGAELAATFGLEDPCGEDAEAAALQVASVAGLTRYGLRLVLTAQVPPSRFLIGEGSEAHNGAVLIQGLAAKEVEAFFADPAGWEDDGLTEAAAGAVAGRTIDQAWASPAVAALLAHAPLAWHDISELAGWLEAV